MATWVETVKRVSSRKVTRRSLFLAAFVGHSALTIAIVGGCGGAPVAVVAKNVDASVAVTTSASPTTSASVAPTNEQGAAKMTALVPPPPFSLVVRATTAAELSVHHLDDGTTLVAGMDESGAIQAFALVRRDRVERLDGVEKGATRRTVPDGVVFGGALPNDLWAARSGAGSACEVSHWDGTAWTPLSPLPNVLCHEIHSVGGGSAIAVVEDSTKQVSLRPVGTPFTAPTLAGCAPICANVHLATWSSSDEILWAGIGCPSGKRSFPIVQVARWKRGDIKAKCVKTDIDPNSPVTGYTGAPGQIVLSALGIPKGAIVSEENLQHLEIRYGMSHSTLSAIEMKPVEMNELEHWTTQVERSKPATAHTEGFDERDLVLGEIGEAFVVGHIVRTDGTKVPGILRSKRVVTPIEL